MITTVSYNQTEILQSIIKLYLKTDGFDYDPTYSKGNFYKSGEIPQPLLKSDLYPQTPDTIKISAESTGFNNNSVSSIMFDPPFLAGYTKEKPTGIIGERFHGFPYVKDLWEWYDKCFEEFYRILDTNGVLVVKCQDTVSSGKQHLSHVHIINKCQSLGFYAKDLFILLAKSRMVGHNHKIQKHARKFHSYFLVFIKEKIK
jgi:DNA modification methylase